MEGEEMREEKLWPLANIVFPEEGFLDVPELFCREGDCLHGFGHGVRRKCRRLSFDTWMNLFAEKKWRMYCDVGRIFLRVRAKGFLRVELVGHALDAGFGSISESLCAIDVDFGEELSEHAFSVELPGEYEAVSFHAVLGEGSLLESAAWCTDREPVRRNRMAVVSCTFRREPYIRATMAKFHEFLEGHPEFRDSFRLFVVDNGKTLEASSSPYIKVIPNMNAGGAGGFARGLMEANDGGFDRCLFLDDDVEIVPESFFRTLAVTDYLREEYRDAFVSGVMMNLHKKTLCTESLTVREGFWIHGYHGNCPVETPRDVLRCIHVDPAVFGEETASSSWWYACFSLESMGGEYPIPAFIRGDDAEWSWRRFGVHHIILNGICVWHLPFEWKTSRLVDRYYLPRNMFLAHAMHDRKFREEFEEEFTRTFDYLAQTLDYPSIDLLLASMRDILKGRKAFAENPLEQRERLNRSCRKADIRPCKDKGELLALKKRSLRSSKGKNGMALDFNTDPQCYKGKDEVRVYHLLHESYELRIRDEEQEQRARREFRWLLYQMGTHYEEISEHLHACHEEFKTRGFWNAYLELDAQTGKGL